MTQSPFQQIQTYSRYDRTLHKYHKTDRTVSNCDSR